MFCSAEFKTKHKFVLVSVASYFLKFICKNRNDIFNVRIILLKLRKCFKLVKEIAFGNLMWYIKVYVLSGYLTSIVKRLSIRDYFSMKIIFLYALRNLGQVQIDSWPGEPVLFKWCRWPTLCIKCTFSCCVLKRLQ